MYGIEYKKKIFNYDFRTDKPHELPCTVLRTSSTYFVDWYRTLVP